MVTFTHIKQKPIGRNAFPLIQNWGSVPIYTIDENDVDEAVDCDT